jgi:hypothetical protein
VWEYILSWRSWGNWKQSCFSIGHGEHLRAATHFVLGIKTSNSNEDLASHDAATPPMEVPHNLRSFSMWFGHDFVAPVPGRNVLQVCPIIAESA